MRHRSKSALGIVALVGAWAFNGHEAPRAAQKPATETPSAAEPSGIEVLVSGSPLHGANGLHFGPDGMLYVASVISGVVAVVDPDTGRIVERLGAKVGVSEPDDVAFGPDGTLCWTNILSGSVGCLGPNGEAYRAGAPGPGVNPLTFSELGRLFVAQCFLDDGLFELDASGREPPRTLFADLGGGCGLNGMDWGADGYLYGPRWFQGRVVKVDVAARSMETVADGFEVPAAVKFGPEGRLHVLDSGAGAVVRLERDGAREQIADLPSGLDNLAFDAAGRLFVSSFTDGFVVEVESPNETRTLLPGGLALPGGVAITRAEGDARLVVADYAALRTFDPTSGRPLSVVRDVIGFSELGTAMTVEPYGGRLLLTSWNDGSVKIWDPAHATTDLELDVFGQPVHAIEWAQGIAVTDARDASVWVVDPERPASRSRLATGFDAPAGLLAHAGSLYLSEYGAGRVLRLARDGETLATPEVVADGLSGPEGLAWASGQLLVVEADVGRLTRVDPEDGTRRVVASGLATGLGALPGVPVTMAFSDVAVDAAGVAYVSGDAGNEIYRLP